MLTLFRKQLKREVSIPKKFPMEKHLRSRNPALNIPRRHEAVATDNIFSHTPAVDSGVKQIQVFLGRDTSVTDAYSMKSGKQLVNVLENNIRRWGAMDKLLVILPKLRFLTKSWIFLGHIIFSIGILLYLQIQNPAEWRYRTIKASTNTGMNRSGAPATDGSYASSMCVTSLTT